MIPGIDISTWQDAADTIRHIDFNKTIAQGAKFVFVKATQALFTDNDFSISWQLAKEAGLIRGAYHYLTWSASGAKQAQYMWSVIKDDPGEFPMVVDFEMATGANAASLPTLKSFLMAIEVLSGKIPIIYTSPGFWKSYGTKELTYLRHPLWIANYEVLKPMIPLPWTSWTFWQYSAKGDGKAYGMESGYVDLDWYNGSLSDLYRLAGKTLVDQTDAEKLRRLWAAHPELH